MHFVLFDQSGLRYFIYDVFYTVGIYLVVNFSKKKILPITEVCSEIRSTGRKQGSNEFRMVPYGIHHTVSMIMALTTGLIMN